MMMYILVTGDFHICKNNYSEVDNSLNQILHVIQTKNISYIAILGDIFNSEHPTLEDVSKFIRFITSIPNHIQIYLVEGNHEKERKDKKLLQWISWIRPNVIHSSDILKTTILNKKIIMMHEAFLESDVHEKAKSNISYTQFKDYDIILSGHVHKYQVISEKPLTIHPGSIYYCNFKEVNDPEKGVVIIDLNTAQYEFIPLKVTKLKQIESSLANAEKLISQLDKNLKVKLILNLNYDESKKVNEINKIIQLGKSRFISFSYDIRIKKPEITKDITTKKRSLSDLFKKFCKDFKVDKKYQDQLKQLLPL